MKLIKNSKLRPTTTLTTILLLATTATFPALAQSNQQQYNETVRSAQQTEMLGYILAGVGFLLVIAAIPLTIYLDRRKKARKQAAKEARQSGRSPAPDDE